MTLLDTHTFVWLASGQKELSAKASTAIGVPPKFDPIVMRGFVLVSGWFRCLAERRP